MKMILLGAPGAGKGTHGEAIAEFVKAPIIGTGQIIRDTIKSGSETGKRFKEYTANGGLIPDEEVVRIVAERLKQPDCANGFVLDGFPRTVAQAEMLEQLVGAVSGVLYLKISDEEIIKRMVGRRTCSKCGASFHVTHHPPKVEGICDRCGGELIIREDDAPETVLNRLAIYHEQTEPVIDFYRSRGVVVEVNSAQEVHKVRKDILAALRLH